MAFGETVAWARLYDPIPARGERTYTAQRKISKTFPARGKWAFVFRLAARRYSRSFVKSSPASHGRPFRTGLESGIFDGYDITDCRHSGRATAGRRR